LVGDGFEERFVGRLRVIDVGVEWDGFPDEAGDAGVAIAEMSYGGV
jgi:hypothetical protein